jgi:ABC-type phosphate transport system substrate-binding protein
LPSGYNIPELAGNYLVLDCETLAAIYLNSITMWNDSRIKSINSLFVASLLPAQPIVVVTLSESSAITQLFTYALNATVPSFAAQVPPPLPNTPK